MILSGYVRWILTHTYTRTTKVTRVPDPKILEIMMTINLRVTKGDINLIQQSITIRNPAKNPVSV